MNSLTPSIETLVREIEAVNRVWKEARSLFGDDSHLAVSVRELKSCLQARLLRMYAPKDVYLVIDYSNTDGEALYSVRLRREIAGRTDAAHLPVRVAKEFLFSTEELKKFQQTHTEQEV